MLPLRGRINRCAFLSCKIRWEQPRGRGFFLFIRGERQLSSCMINTSPRLIVKCVNDTYKSKKFSKMKWNCINNDILNSINKFNIEEILNIINIVSRLNIGKNILIKFKPLITSNLHSIKCSFLGRIITCYIRANVNDNNFYFEICSKIQNNLNDIPYSSLIGLLYNINFYSSVKNEHISNVEKEILNYLVMRFEVCELTNTCEGRKDPRGENGVMTLVAHNVVTPTYDNTSVGNNEINAKVDIDRKDKEKDEEVGQKDKMGQHWNLHNLKNYNTILLLYSISNYLLKTYLQKDHPSTMNDHLEYKLKQCYDTLNRINREEELKVLLEKLNLFYLFLLYKAVINNIYIYGDENVSEILFNHIKNKINNFIVHLKKNSLNVKGKSKGTTNALIKYVNILQQNLVNYSENKKIPFQNYLIHNVALVKSLLFQLQQNNKNDINK
ncbi:conserved Plasmodium protein, unknown function [Plasmodium ovale wallikeri]|uniref:Uncharacterized protein n=2 Tax=Plasmodium ovale TaxID=36330 RepID=A0A1A8ZYW5_PLAOA|nr:conserved Plasmodium protein, unknown function [Plasmodium ovale wallikeri]SBT49349.1 conserved Plasmodium protein, unknown function [Plasmodium ovale wallikeri]SBT82559.1 conserved Plasmodium protein, unknown function [Plasmodium ovale]